MNLDNLLINIAKRLKQTGRRLVTAESCTGGSISSVITSIPGSSEWFDRAYITYSNRAKKEMLGVSDNTLSQYGAVSRETVCSMAEGALLKEDDSIAVAVSGIAGPDGGSKEKPVGTVWIGWCQNSQAPEAEVFLFTGDREAIRQAAVFEALSGILDRLMRG